MKFFQKIGFLIVFLVLTSFSVKAQQRPLLTEDVDTVKTGHIRLQLGFEFLQDQRFGLSKFRGDLTKVGVVGVHIGVAPRVSFSVEGTLRNFLDINEKGLPSIPLTVLPNKNSTSDVGDFTVSTKIKLLGEGLVTPSIGFKLGVMLPNSDQAKGIGTNTTNVFATALVGKNFIGDRIKTFGNVGMGILSGTKQSSSQQDVLLYGIGTILKLNNYLDVLGEVNGKHNPRNPQLGLESQLQGRLGVRLHTGNFQWDLSAIKGGTQFSPKTGVAFGMTYEMSVFNIK